MTTFRCPKCGMTGSAIATTMAHRCKSNRNLMTEWESINGNENSNGRPAKRSS